MGNLKNTRYYSVGNIDDSDDRGAGFRNELDVRFAIKYGCKQLNPLIKNVLTNQLFNEDKTFAEYRDGLFKEKKYVEYSALMKEVRRIDLRMLMGADFVVAYLDLSKKLCGSWEELFLANQHQLPVLIVCPQGVEKLSPWLYGVLPFEYFFNNFDELDAYLDKIDKGNFIGDGRWLFFSR